MYADVDLHVVCMGAKKRLSGVKGSQGQHDMLNKPHHSMYDAQKSLCLLTLLLFGLSCALVLALAELATLPWHPSCLCLASFA